MAKRSKVAPARKQREESLLVRSAESLGRIIGSLHRELDAGGWFSGTDHRATDPALRARAQPPNGAAGAGSRSKPGTAKARPAGERGPTRAASAPAARKSAGRGAGVRKAARKTSRGG